jgi:hypothetical protein
MAAAEVPDVPATAVIYLSVRPRSGAGKRTPAGAYGWASTDAAATADMSAAA